MNILVTGGLGFIGSHIAVELLKNNYNVIIIDNLSNSKNSVLSRIAEISNKKVIFYRKNLKDDISQIFNDQVIYAVIHLAGLKSVGESVNNPLLYYSENINSTINLIKTMERYGCKNLIFSSSATVYGNQKSPLREDMKIGNDITNPYGKTKYMIEEILNDYSKSNNNFNIISLRYFNPIGSHPSGLIGEDPNGLPNNLMPYILNVAYKNNIDFTMKGYDCLSIFGDNYNTKDGTAIRDYIHVADLARAHFLALKKIEQTNKYRYYNIGSGKGTSVLDIINTFKKVNKINLPYQICERRVGDLEEVFCDTTKSKKELGFKPKYNLSNMCKHSWNFKNKR